MKNNTFQFLFFTGFLLIGAASLVTSNNIMANFSNNGYLVYLFLLPLILLLPLLLSNHKVTLKICFTHPILKILFLSYQILSNFILITSYLKVTNDYYYSLTSPTIIFIIFLFASLFFTNYGIRNILHIGFVLSCITLTLMLFPLTSNADYDFVLLNNTSLELNLDISILGFLFIYLDSFLLLVFNPSSNISKKHFFILFLIISLINTGLILQNYLLFDFQYFLTRKFPYITKYLVFSNYYHYLHLDLFYLIFITIYFLFKLSINIEYSRIILEIKRNSYKIFLIPLFLFVLIYISPYFDLTVKNLNWLMFYCTLIIFSFFILLKIFIFKRRKNE